MTDGVPVPIYHNYQACQQLDALWEQLDGLNTRRYEFDEGELEEIEKLIDSLREDYKCESFE